jgi:hypothetical protein
MLHRSRSNSRSSREGVLLHSASSTDVEIHELRAQQRADRDARSVGRLLQQHQVETASTLSSMQDRMEVMAVLQGLMATMMQRMQGSLDRLAPKEGIPATPPPTPAVAVLFPPHRYAQTLTFHEFYTHPWPICTGATTAPTEPIKCATK